MKAKLMKKLVIAGVLMLLAQTEAMASSTQVTFQIPLRMTSYHVATSDGITCQIFHGRQRVGSRGLAGTGILNRYAGRTVTIRVPAMPGKTFQKGDTWSCSVMGRIAVDPKLDRGRSTLEVQGTL